MVSAANSQESVSDQLTADVVIIGGGPGGTSVATYLARAGLKVVLFERETFPRFRIGESLLPLNLPILRELGVEEEVDRRFIRKFAANFSDRWGARQARFPFVEGVGTSYRYAYEVERSVFDQILLTNAEKSGASIHMGWAVRDVLWDGDRAVGVRAKSLDSGQDLRVLSSIVVDASGRSAFLGSRLGLRRDMSLPTRTAFFAHFDDVDREPGEKEGDIQIVAFTHGWFWMIPFKGNVTSVGVVVTDDYLKKHYGGIRDQQRIDHDESNEAIAGRPEAINDVLLRRAIESTPFVANRMHTAKAKWPARSIANFSFRMERYTGDGYVLLGDASAFLDPVFSTGVFLTMKAAQLASRDIIQCIRDGDCSARRFQAYESRVRAAQELFFRFIRGWYDPAFVDMFFYSRNILGLRSAIIRVLAADVFDAKSSWRLQIQIRLLFWIVAVHRFWLRWRRGGRSLVQQVRT